MKRASDLVQLADVGAAVACASAPLTCTVSRRSTRVFCLLASSRLASRPKPNARIKHDGFRIIARKDGPKVRLYSRPGNDLTIPLPAHRGVLSSAAPAVVLLRVLKHQK